RTRRRSHSRCAVGDVPAPGNGRAGSAGQERDPRTDRRQPAGQRDPRMAACDCARTRAANDGRGPRTMTRRYLITGAQGLVGRYLTARILDMEPESEVVGIGRSANADGFFTHSIPTYAGQGRAPF